MSVNRRKFILNSSLALLASLVPSPLTANVLHQELFLTLTLGQRLKIAADLRKQGKIKRAINKFTRLIKDYPNEIRAYDGLRKSLLQKKI